ncbi:MAG: BadF/BadG/BcrA/BcrD ATPase family protein [Flexilinea sp.]
MNRNRETHCSGGFGYLLDDEGSGYKIGQLILTTIIRSYDEREKHTIFTKLAAETFDLHSASDIMNFVHNCETPKKQIASIARLLPLAYLAGDSSAIKIAVQITDQLVDLTLPVIRKLSLEHESVAMCGGIFVHHEYITNAYQEKMKGIYPKITSVFPKNYAAYGTMLIARELIE